jgi:hypothetical protein
VLPAAIRARVSVEAGITPLEDVRRRRRRVGRRRPLRRVAPAAVLYKEFGITAEAVAAAAASIAEGPGLSRPGADYRLKTARKRVTMADVLGQLTEAGVSVWLDDISRERLRTGNLASLIKDFHVVGVTSNPTIFANALAKGDAYDDQIKDLAIRGVASTKRPG